MAVTLTMTLSDADGARVVAMYANTRDYANTKQAGETQSQFAKRMLIEDVRAQVQSYEVANLRRQIAAPVDVVAT